MNDTNPYSPTVATGDDVDTEPRKGRRSFRLMTVAALGILAGSYVSAEINHIRYPSEPRSDAAVLSGTIVAVLSSPITMTFGVFPTMRFYAPHGWLVFPGVIIAVIETIRYLRLGGRWALWHVFVGFLLWSHNNYLSLSALMSV